MKKLIIALALSIVACLASDYGVKLWEDHTGFLWGFLAVFVFGLGVGCLRASVQCQWKEWVVKSLPRNVIMRVINGFISLVLLCCGYCVLMIGWHYWWTGICASLFIGIEGLLVGIFAMIVAVALLVASFFSRTWLRKSARLVDRNDHMQTAEEFFKE